MHRLHDDDLRNHLKPEYRGYVMKWLETLGAAVVVPDDVRVPHGTMGQSQRQRGEFGVTEPWPPYDSERQIMVGGKAGRIGPPEAG